MAQVLNPELERHIPDTGIVLILGNKGSGKSALGFALLHLAKKMGREAKFYDGEGRLRGRKTKLLPDWITLSDSIEPEQNSVKLYDEAYLPFHARSHRSKEGQTISRLAGLARHYNTLAIFITQSVGKLDVNLIRDSDVWLLKEPSAGQATMDRKEFRPVLQKAGKEFGMIPGEERKRSTYVSSGTTDKMVRNSNGIPSFWSEELSKAQAGVGQTGSGGNGSPDSGSGRKRRYQPYSPGTKLRDIVVVR